MRTATRASALAARIRWLSSDPLALLGVSLAMEAFVVAAWLHLLAAYTGAGVDQPAAPLWYLMLALLLACGVGRRLSERSGVVTALVTLPLFAATLLLLVRVSPGGYAGAASGPLDLGWLAALAADLAGATDHLGALAGLAALLAYLWRRGLAVARTVAYARTQRRFTVAVAALVVACASIVPAPPGEQAALNATLALLLPAAICCGLAALALARVAEARTEPGGALDSANETRWLGTALGLALLVVTLALALSLIVNLSSLDAILQRLGPAGQALDAALRWLVNGFAWLLYLALDPLVQSLRHAVQSAPTPTPTPSSPSSGSHPTTTAPSLSPVWQSVALATTQIALALFVLLLVVLLLRAFTRRRPRTLAASPDEEREALDASALLRQQARALLAGLLPRRVASEEGERLAPGSVRALYRETLLAAAARGTPRLPAETPDEFAARLGRTPPLAHDDARVELDALSDAYDAARYADREPEPAAREPLRRGAARLIARLRETR